MLTAGFLVGSAGGAIAKADTESTGSTTSTSASADGSSASAAPASAPTTSTASTPKYPISTAVQDVLRKLRSLGQPGPKPPFVLIQTQDPVIVESETGTAESDDVTMAATDTAAPDSNVVATDSNSNPPPTNFAASGSNLPTSSADVVGPALKAVAPVGNAVASVAGAALSMPGVFMALPNSPAPVADVITSMQNMLMTVNDAITPLAQVPGDLYSLLVVAGMNATTGQQIGSSAAVGLSAATSTGLTPPVGPVPLPVMPISPDGGMPLLGDVVAAATLGGIATAGLSADLSLSGTAPLATAGAGPTGALSFLEHTVKAVLAPVSLSALAAFAVPGIGGLLIICAAGMRVGYRQAKAALTVRTTGIARFARQGPLGVVRSGSLVALHQRRPRGLRVVRSEVSPAAPLLEQAA
jgi:hypothetical protein